MQWKALTAFGDTTLASTISYCLNFQQRLKRDENLLISPIDIEGKITNIIEFMEINVNCDYDSKKEFHVFLGSSPFVVFARASILMNCKIQTMCVKTNTVVRFTPPEAMDEDFVKMIYYDNEIFTMCQRVLEIRMNEENQDLSKQMAPDFSNLCNLLNGNYIFKDYYVVYGYDYFYGVYDIEIYTNLSLLQKFERFFEKIPLDSSIAFVFDKRNAPFVPLFIKALSIQLERKPPFDAMYDQDIVQTWLSNNESRGDLIAHSSTLNNMKTEFIINLSSIHERKFATRNAKTQYSHIFLTTPTRDEHEAMTFLSSENYKQSDEAYLMYRNKFEKYLRKKN